MTLDLKFILQIKEIDIFCVFRSRNICDNVSTKFSNKKNGGGGGLTGSFFEGVVRKEIVTFFRGGGCIFYVKNKLKSEYLKYLITKKA